MDIISLHVSSAGGWCSFVAAMCMLVFQLRYQPASRQQMRPRMLLVLLSLDALSGLFFSLSQNVFNDLASSTAPYGYFENTFLILRYMLQLS
jgi:hypothetical protein